MLKIALPLKVVFILAIVFLTACEETIPKDALQLNEVTLEVRQRQTRYFDTTNEKKILTASAAVLQDLGFNIDESETELGLVFATKDRDATEAGQVAGAFVIALLFGVPIAVDDEQKIRVSLVTRPRGKNKEQVAVRVTFQRVVWDTAGDVARSEPLDDAELYQGFFNRLSQSVFLEAHQI